MLLYVRCYLRGDVTKLMHVHSLVHAILFGEDVLAERHHFALHLYQSLRVDLRVGVIAVATDQRDDNAEERRREDTHCQTAVRCAEDHRHEGRLGVSSREEV